MRSFSNAPLTTLLLLMPLAVIPLLAVFGIPEFAPVSASPSGDYEALPSLASTVDVGVGLSSRYTPDDLFAPIASGDTIESDPLAAKMQEEWTDPFKVTEAGSGAFAESITGRFKNSRPTDSDAERIRFLAEENSKEAISRTSNPPSGRSRLNQTDAVRADNGFLSLVDFEQARRRAVGGRSSVPIGQIADLDTASVRSPSVETEQSKLRAAVQSQSNETISPFERAALQRLPRRNERASTASSEPLTWGHAVERLNDLGIRHFQLQPGERTTEFHFSCFFTPPDTPQITHRFEAEATDPLIAVGQVLAQVERWSAQRRASSRNGDR